jgi:hypothetical protein
MNTLAKKLVLGTRSVGTKAEGLTGTRTREEWRPDTNTRPLEQIQRAADRRLGHDEEKHEAADQTGMESRSKITTEKQTKETM